MSYARFSHADVYVFMNVNGYLDCCGCILGDQYAFHSTDAMIDHLAQHRDAGHDVPDGIEDELRADDTDNFPPQCANGHEWGEPFHPYPNHEQLASITRRKCTKCGWTR